MMSNLQDLHRPLVGGLQISSTKFICTLGFSTKRNGVEGFVTNAHCTDIYGVVESTRFGQPNFVTEVGIEEVDPAFFVGGTCPSNFRCRYSDAAFARTTGLTAVDQGHIATPSTTIVRTTWDGVSTYSIIKETDPLLNDGVLKVGRTTGRTAGVVERTCVNVRVAGEDILMLCQAIASYESDGGDSGAPVLTTVDGPRSWARGIHWGSGGVFSPISNIQRIDELGSVETCIPDRSC